MNWQTGRYSSSETASCHLYCCCLPCHHYSNWTRVVLRNAECYLIWNYADLFTSLKIIKFSSNNIFLWFIYLETYSWVVSYLFLNFVWKFVFVGSFGKILFHHRLFNFLNKIIDVTPICHAFSVQFLCYITIIIINFQDCFFLNSEWQKIDKSYKILYPDCGSRLW